MKAFVLHGPSQAGVVEVSDPEVSPGEVLIEVGRAGICGTDVELFTGEMQYLHDGNAGYPLRPGHEWMGVVADVGEGVDRAWLGQRVTGDTMLGCGECCRCNSGRHHVCASRTELGIRGGRPGALAQRLAFPAGYLHALPDAVDDTAGALVEPAGNAIRAVRAAELIPGERLLVLGTGTIGLLVAMFARADGVQVHLLGRDEENVQFARTVGFEQVWTEATLPGKPWDGIIDASNAAHLPARALDLVEPGRRVVYIGLAGSPSVIDTRALVLKDVTAIGILGASAGLPAAIEAFANGSVDPRPLVAATVELDDLAGILAGRMPEGAGPGPKVHVAITNSGERQTA